MRLVLDLVRSLGSRYNHQITQRPLFTKVWSSGLLWFLSDSICQYIERSNPVPLPSIDIQLEKEVPSSSSSSSSGHAYDIGRALRGVSYGAFVFAPLAHVWYGGLEIAFSRLAFLRRVAGSSRVLSVVIRVALDQLLWAPSILGLLFLTFGTLETGGQIEEGTRRVRAHLWETLKANWTLWPCAQLLTFTVIPLHHRLLFINAVAVPWNAYLSYQANRKSS